MSDVSFDPVIDEAAAASYEERLAYLVGATHDSTQSTLHRTTRFCQSEPRWLDVLRVLLDGLGYKSWVYREGALRHLWVLETSWRPPTAFQPGHREAERAYLRAYFDTDGGVPRDPHARFYIQYAQKDRADLNRARALLQAHSINCGKLHNPSKAIAPDYWRFFVRSACHNRFIQEIGSWHPRKRHLFDQRRLSKHNS